MMTYRSLVLALAATPLAMAGEPGPVPPPPPIVTSVAEPRSGWFVGVKGSALWLEDIGYTVGSRFGEIQIDADFDVGWGVTVPFGYRFDSGFSIGASAGYYTSDLDNVTVRLDGDNLGKLGLEADPAVVPLLLNAAYSFSLTDALSLTLGAGVGVAWHEFDLDRIQDLRYDASFDGWDWSFQGFGGFNYSISQTTDLTLGYRYIHTETDEDAIQGHNLEAGVIIRF